MAEARWLDVSGTWTTGANWSTAAAPVATDDVRILRGSQIIAVAVPGAGATVDYNSFRLGPEFEGRLGTSGSPVYLGTMGNVWIESERCTELYIGPGNSDTITDMMVDATNDAGVNIVGGTSSAVTRMTIRRARRFRLLASSIVTTLDYFAAGVLQMDTSATLTTVRQYNGTILNAAAQATLQVFGGIFFHQGDATPNITTLMVAGGEFRHEATGGTITTVVVGPKGYFNCNAGEGRARTVTNLIVYPGGTADLSGKGVSVTVTNTYDLGGRIIKG